MLTDSDYDKIVELHTEKRQKLEYIEICKSWLKEMEDTDAVGNPEQTTMVMSGYKTRVEEIRTELEEIMFCEFGG